MRWFHAFLSFMLASASAWGAAWPAPDVEITHSGPLTFAVLRNKAPVAITGVIVYAHRLDDSAGPRTGVVNARTQYDSLLSVVHRPIAGGAVAKISAPGLAGTPSITKVVAGAFADGATFGDSDWIGVLLNKRRACADELSSVLDYAASVSGRSNSADMAESLKTRMAERKQAARVRVEQVSSLEASPEHVSTSRAVMMARDAEACVEYAYLPFVSAFRQPPAGDGAPLSTVETLQAVTQLTQERLRKLTESLVKKASE